MTDEQVDDLARASKAALARGLAFTGTNANERPSDRNLRSGWRRASGSSTPIPEEPTEEPPT